VYTFTSTHVYNRLFKSFQPRHHVLEPAKYAATSIDFDGVFIALADVVDLGKVEQASRIFAVYPTGVVEAFKVVSIEANKLNVFHH